MTVRMLKSCKTNDGAAAQVEPEARAPRQKPVLDTDKIGVHGREALKLAQKIRALRADLESQELVTVVKK